MIRDPGPQGTIGLPVYVVVERDGQTLSAFPDPYEAKHYAQRLAEDKKRPYDVLPGRLIILPPEKP